jgi:hypothetical protein
LCGGGEQKQGGSGGKSQRQFHETPRSLAVVAMAAELRAGVPPMLIQAMRRDGEPRIPNHRERDFSLSYSICDA